MQNCKMMRYTEVIHLHGLLIFTNSSTNVGLPRIVKFLDDLWVKDDVYTILLNVFACTQNHYYHTLERDRDPCGIQVVVRAEMNSCVSSSHSPPSGQP